MMNKLIPEIGMDQVILASKVLVIAAIDSNSDPFTVELDGFYGPEGQSLGDFLVTVTCKRKGPIDLDNPFQ